MANATHTGVFKLDGKEAQLIHHSYAVHRNTDEKGRPGSRVLHFTLNVTIASDDKLKLSIIEWMGKPDMDKKGEIIEYLGEGSDRQEFKKIEFENGYVIDYTENFHDMNGSNNVSETFIISAEKITINGAKFDFKWPKS
jgi:adenine-specific DNA methylase